MSPIELSWRFKKQLKTFSNTTQFGQDDTKARSPLLNNADRFLVIPLRGATFKQRCSALLPNITMTMIWLNSNLLNYLVLYHFHKTTTCPLSNGHCPWPVQLYCFNHLSCCQGALVCFYQINMTSLLHCMSSSVFDSLIVFSKKLGVISHVQPATSY